MKLRSIVACASVALVLPLVAEAAAAQTFASDEPSLDDVRSATERFRDVEVALAEGYIPDPMNMCVTAELEGLPPELGAMGIHYVHPGLLELVEGGERVNGNSTHTDFLQPSILIYEPQADGSLELVAVENLVFIRAWEAAGGDEPPTFHGRSFDLMVDDPRTSIDEAHGFEPHYDLHVWLYRTNPDGVFSPFNRAVTCEHHVHGPER